MAKVEKKFTPATWGFYTPHQPVTEDGRMVNPHTGEVTYPPSMTKQDFVSQCDINNIIKEFSVTGQISHISAKAAQGAFIDLPADLDYQNSLNTIIRAEEAFMALPAKVRDRFGGDPAAFLAFTADPENADELVKLGIRNPPPRGEPAPRGQQTPPTAAPAAVPSQSPPAGEAPGGSQKPA